MWSSVGPFRGGGSSPRFSGALIEARKLISRSTQFRERYAARIREAVKKSNGRRQNSPKIGTNEGVIAMGSFVVESSHTSFPKCQPMLYYFRPFTDADLPLVARWLKTPEVTRWWGDPEHELTVLAQDLDEPSMRQWIVEYRGRPFAYVQAYPAGAWPQAHLKHLSADTQMIVSVAPSALEISLDSKEL